MWLFLLLIIFRFRFSCQSVQRRLQPSSDSIPVCLLVPLPYRLAVLLCLGGLVSKL